MGQNGSKVHSVPSSLLPEKLKDKEKKPTSEIHRKLHGKVSDYKELKRINQYQLSIAAFDNKQILSFVSKVPIKDPTNYNGFAQVFNQQRILIFEGEFKNSQRNGYGIEYDLHHQVVYEGEFYQGVYNGWGIYMKEYEGQFRKGKRQGYGVYSHIASDLQSLTYEGYWKNDTFHGLGCLNVKPLQVIPLLKNSNTVILDKNIKQTKYIGQWQGGHLNGIGKFIKEEQVYEGWFQNGQYEGNGLLYQKNCDSIKGYFENGVLIKKIK